jgi:hypothetical protein
LPYPDAKGPRLQTILLRDFGSESNPLSNEKRDVLSVNGALEIIISKSCSASSIEKEKN